MLANPKRCPYCEGEGTMPALELPLGSTAIVSDIQCFNCHGSGVVCALCGKPDGECGCETKEERKER